MKLWICYVIWNKAAHIPWICEGIRLTMPKGTHVDFVLDNCTDQTEAHLNTVVNANGYGGLEGYTVTIHKSTKQYRWPNTNDSIGRFLTSDCTHFFSPQDDQQIQDKFIFGNLEKLYSEADNIGFVGMRDGVTESGHFFSSCFSKPTPKTSWLKSGQYISVKYVNDGPICISRQTIQKVGVFNPDFIAHYTDNDYSFRCNKLGLTNYVMGAEIIHEKWECKVCGPLIPSQVWTQEVSDHDYRLYKILWPT